jgi:hypothetical protein
MEALQKQQMTTLAAKVAASVPEIKSSVEKAVTAMSAIKNVQSDDDLEKVNNILKKVRATFTKHDSTRKEITKELDNAKKQLIDLTRPISPTDKKSEYTRVKSLADHYVNEKERKAREEAARIEREKQARIERETLLVEFDSRVTLGVQDLLDQGELGLTKFKSSLTLDNWNVQVAKLNYKPILKKETFVKWLREAYNSIETDNTDESIIDDFAKANFEKAAKVYQDEAISKLEAFKKELPDYKTKLEHGNAINQESELARLKAEQEEKRKEAEKKAQEAKDEALINNEFEAQVQKQSLETVESGVRRSNVVTLSDDLSGPELINVMSKIMLHVLESDGATIKKDNGDYVDGISYWLKKFARLKEIPAIKGIQVQEKLTSVVR